LARQEGKGKKERVGKGTEVCVGKNRAIAGGGEGECTRSAHDEVRTLDLKAKKKKVAKNK